MKWDIAENCRAYVVGYSGVNYSGDRFEARVFPSGLQGDPLDGAHIKSMSVVAPLGMRIVLRTTLQDDWEEQTWRAICMVKGKTFLTSEGHHAVRIPDLDALNAPDAWRLNPDVEESYPLVKSLEAGTGTGWTYGRVGRQQLKNGVVMIQVDKLGALSEDDSEG